MRVDVAAARLVRFLETGEAPAGLFTDDAAHELGPRGLRRVIGRRCDATERGFVLEIEESWEADGQSCRARGLARADLRGEAIEALALYCVRV